MSDYHIFSHPRSIASGLGGHTPLPPRHEPVSPPRSARERALAYLEYHPGPPIADLVALLEAHAQVAVWCATRDLRARIAELEQVAVCDRALDGDAAAPVLAQEVARG